MWCRETSLQPRATVSRLMHGWTCEMKAAVFLGSWWPVHFLVDGFLPYAGMSGGVPGARGIASLAVGSLVSCLDVFQSFLLDVLWTVTSFPMICFWLVWIGSFYFGRMLSSLLCHWLVGRGGRRGSLDVVHFLGDVSFVCGSRISCLDVVLQTLYLL